MHNQNFMYHIYVEIGIFCSKALCGGGGEGDLHFNPPFPKSAERLGYFTVLCK